MAVAGIGWQVGDGNEESSKPQRTAYLIRIPLPIGSLTAQQVAATLSGIAANAPQVTRPEDRQVVILEFATDSGETGQGSKLTDCLELAQVLTNQEMNQLQTVAWIPRLRANAIVQENRKLNKGLYGHAVLVALACDSIAIDQTMRIGRADADEKRRNPLAIGIYQNSAEQRRLIPVEIVNAMIDPAASLSMVRVGGEDKLVDMAGMQELLVSGVVTESTTLSEAGETAILDGATLQRIAPTCRSVDGIGELSSRLKVDLSRVESDSMAGRKLKGIRHDLIGYIDAQKVEWIIRAMDQKTRADNGVNLVLLSINSSGGDLRACTKLAEYLAGFDRDNVRTSAWVNGEARGGAAIIALACDHVLASPESVIGGAWDPGLQGRERGALYANLISLAEIAGRDPGLFIAVIDPEAEVNRYRNQSTGEVKWMTPRLHEDAVGDWQLLEPVDTLAGMDVSNAEKDGLVRARVSTNAELEVYYQLDDSPEVLTPTKTDAFLLLFARKLNDPVISFFLVMFGFSMIMTELSQPGLSLPGLIGGICLILYFWSHYLGGSAAAFEIILFIAGVVLLLVEIFVLPGFGVFGIIGGMSMVTSIVLASQTFVLPRNSEELAQMPGSLMMAVAAGLGFFGAIFLIQRFLPDTPYFNRIMLQPPTPRDPELEKEPAEGMRIRVGASGIAVTPLVPAGKARINGRVVDVLTRGVAVDRDQEIEVLESTGNRIVVGPVTPK